jgi:hypothetical protein
MIIIAICIVSLLLICIGYINGYSKGRFDSDMESYNNIDEE